MKRKIRRCLATLSTTILAVSVTAQDLGPGVRPVGEDWSRSPVMAVNGMAATAQPQTSSIPVDGLTQGGSAVGAARFLYDGGSSPDEGIATDSGTLFVEPGVPSSTLNTLRALGHVIEVDDTVATFSGYEAVSRDLNTGALTDATEMRKNGTVDGY